MASAAKKKKRPTKRTAINLSKFVAYYIIDCNGTQAYLTAHAGKVKESTAATEASRLLNDHKVQQMIEEARAIHLKEIGVEATQVLRELNNMARFDPSVIMNWDGSTLTCKKFDDIPAEARRMISEISQDKHGFLKIKFHNKQAALKDLAQYLGCLPNKLEHSGPEGSSIPMEVNLNVKFK